MHAGAFITFRHHAPRPHMIGCPFWHSWRSCFLLIFRFSGTAATDCAALLSLFPLSAALFPVRVLDFCMFAACMRQKNLIKTRGRALSSGLGCHVLAKGLRRCWCHFNGIRSHLDGMDFQRGNPTLAL